MPLLSAVSWREPRVSHTPMLIERTCVMRSVRMRSPLPRTSRTIGEFDKVTLAAGTAFNRWPGMCRKALRQKELPADQHYNTGPRLGQASEKGDGSLFRPLDPKKTPVPFSGIRSRSRQVVTNVRDTV